MPETRYVTQPAVFGVPEPARSPEPRFALYRLCPCGACSGSGKHEDVRCPECRGEGRQKQLVAECETDKAVGVAIVTLGREGEFHECPFGLLDREGETNQKWLVSPWLPSPRNISDAGKVLASKRWK